MVRIKIHEVPRQAVSPRPCYILSLRLKYLSQHTVLNIRTLRSSLNVKYWVLYPSKIRHKIKFCIFHSLYCWIAKWKTQNSGPNSRRHLLSSMSSRFIHECNFDVLVFSPNIWTLPQFQRIAWLRLCFELSQHSGNLCFVTLARACARAERQSKFGYVRVD